jgi:hypothetical protein
MCKSDDGFLVNHSARMPKNKTVQLVNLKSVSGTFLDEERSGQTNGENR